MDKFDIPTHDYEERTIHSDGILKITVHDSCILYEDIGCGAMDAISDILTKVQFHVDKCLENELRILIRKKLAFLIPCLSIRL